MPLCQVPETKVFKKLRTRENNSILIVHEIFKSSCCARILLEDDDKYQHCFVNACCVEMQAKLTKGFHSYLFGNQHCPIELWEHLQSKF